MTLKRLWSCCLLPCSRMVVDTPDGTRRIKGALLNDGISGLFSALATSLPLTTFAQNNGRRMRRR